MVKNREAEIPVTPGSGNVFADLGFAEPEEELAKAQLASHIRQTIRRRRLTQVAAAALMGIDQPKVSALLNGRLANFSSDRLMRLLTALGLDVDITVKAKPRDRARGRIRVIDTLADCTRNSHDPRIPRHLHHRHPAAGNEGALHPRLRAQPRVARSEEHPYELQSLMRNPYAVFCLKK